MNKASKIIEKIKTIKGKRNVNPIKKVNEAKELPHISTASEEKQATWEKMVDRGDHPEQAANRLGHTTIDPKTK